MFALSAEDRSFSPLVMRFHTFWIYDLRSTSQFWKEKISKQSCVILGKSPWEALLPVYGLQNFSDLWAVDKFAQDYFSLFHPKVSRAQQKKVFAQLHRLGIRKIGHLRKLPASQIKQRWGEAWSQFLRGLLLLEEVHWPWISERKPLWIEEQEDFDFGVTDLSLLEAAILQVLEKVLKKTPSLYLKRIHIEFCSQEPGEDQELELHFHSHPLLSQSLNWIRRLLVLRLAGLSFFSAISRIRVHIEPSPPVQAAQLQLFSSRLPSISLEEFKERLESLGGKVFQPESLPHSLPEKSWRMTAPSKDFQLPSVVWNRPLIQYEPIPLKAPEFRLFPVEKIDEFDEKGNKIHRDYFVGFFRRRWRWLYQDQNQNWYEQGLAE